MENPGIYNLGDLAITTAGTQNGEPVTDLDGMLAAAVQLRFAYGSGGTSTKAYLQASADQGTTWFDIACAVFGTASETALLNFSALTPKTTQVNPTDGGLADDTAVDGLLSDRMRLKVVSVGTYAGNTLLSARLVVR
ncbi:hypothetical protein [Aminobacter aminovorans]|uniref:Uncharacterized protein n=1 Tax=Aminobacter aminovorans TaxID=83263 RepID=A0AAC8YMP3_AMIAI|nr:hypothetical protein [Aminobacter aminovorans]AMS41163.1 hypothetical protein AA2016_2234 [Aminobacter aminovorans]MBB3705855.1 hypothetical protein [Aminobacter aminovorans]